MIHSFSLHNNDNITHTQTHTHTHKTALNDTFLSLHNNDNITNTHTHTHTHTHTVSQCLCVLRSSSALESGGAAEAGCGLIVIACAVGMQAEREREGGRELGRRGRWNEKDVKRESVEGAGGVRSCASIASGRRDGARSTEH